MVDGLTRTQIVQYAGASGDFNPLHTDEIFATEVAGHASLIAHGMLTMGLIGLALCDVVEQERVTGFGGRFKQPVLPGDSLTAEISMEAGDEPDVISITLVARNQNGNEVFVGYAVATAGSSNLP